MPSTSKIKPIKLWGRAGPNPPKVIMVLEELGLPHEIIHIPRTEIKGPEYLALNPNGRLPTIQDPNTGLTLWESGAIIEYLVDRYDSVEHKLSFPAGTAEAYHAKQWLYFQTSGQGPYYGQATWFKMHHHEQLPSAIDRYVKEINRVTGVLELHLARQEAEYGVGNGGTKSTDGPWLVGNKYSYADLSFVMWQQVAVMSSSKDEFDLEAFPHVKGWHGKLMAKEVIKRVFDAALKAMAESKS